MHYYFSLREWKDDALESEILLPSSIPSRHPSLGQAKATMPLTDRRAGLCTTALWSGWLASYQQCFFFYPCRPNKIHSNSTLCVRGLLPSYSPIHSIDTRVDTTRLRLVLALFSTGHQRDPKLGRHECQLSTNHARLHCGK